ncbi:LysM peptidoglycan-binding domain-containing protein [Rufibacter soli]
MKKSFSLLLLSLLCLVARAQNPVVPNNIYFADLHLEIKESARTDIQKMVDALLQHPAYFQKKVDLADAYFPFVEQALKQEGVPTDFKYLVLQESGLVSDAVSTSNAVGFWQFKEGSATELGIKVNSQVDERKHIIESSRGAAKYLLRSNAYYKNWFNSLLSYYQGLNGTKALTRTADIGAKKMEVTSQTNKYLLTFLAHKVAYENAIGKNPSPVLTLQPVKAAPGQTLTEIAMAAQADAAEVERYNKWLLASRVPSDKEYTVMVPQLSGAPRPVLAQASSPVWKSSSTSRTAAKPRGTVTKPNDSISRIKGFFATLKAKLTGQPLELKSIVAQPGDTKDMLALQGNISTSKFLEVNDMSSYDPIVPGQTYYLQAKNSRTLNPEYHEAQPGETMHSVSQKYGIKLKKLLAKNRMTSKERLEPGRMVWLKETRPASIPVEIRPQVQGEPVPAPKEVIAQNTAPVAQPAAARPTPATKPAAISVVVEDTTVAPYVKKARQEEEEAAPVTAAAQYPGKKTAVAIKPAPPLERKAPDEPATAELETAGAVVGATSHVVEKGETLYAISRKFGVSMEDLLAWNNLDGSAPLALGKELVLVAPSGQVSAVPTTGATPTKTTAAPATKPIAGVKEHTVVAGETLYAISRKYGVTLQDLQTWNDLGTGAISIGQVLVVAAPAPAQEVAPASAPAAKTATGVVTHQVAPGESMYAISRKYGVTIKEIMEWNNKPDFNVTVGENLIVKPKQ